MTSTKEWWPALRSAGLTATAALSELIDIVAPQVCAQCGAAAGPLCPACGVALAQTQRDRYAGVRPSPAPLGWPSASAWGRYTPPLSTLLHAYKDLDRRDLAMVLSPLLGQVITHVMESCGNSHAASVHLLIPIPSSRAARRARGDRPLEALVKSALGTLPLSTQNRAVHVPRLLLHTRRIADQAGLNQADRAANLRGAITVSSHARTVLQGASCLLIDDIVTTGATAMAATRALLDGGAAQVHIVALAAVERTSGRNRDVRAGNA